MHVLTRYVMVAALLLAGSAAGVQAGSSSAGPGGADPNYLPDPALGVDARVDYRALVKLGPWDDRNYQLRLEDLAILPDKDAYRPGVPVFFKILKRREMAAQGFPLVDDLYPRELDKEFQYRFGGLKQAGVLHLTERGKHHYTGPGAASDVPAQRWATDPVARGIDSDKALVLGQGPFDGTLSDNETTIEFHPTNPDIAIAGSNGSGGQRMSYSTDGGVTWGNSGALPGTCCDPAIEFISDGSIAFAATLGQSASGCAFSLCSTVYWTFNGGQSWQGPVHTSTASSDKEFIHVDKSPTSPFQDSVYLTWHQGNVMQFARSTALPVDGGAPLAFAPAVSFSADERGIGSDIATDRQGRIYYVYPSVTSGSAEVYLLRSDDGGVSFVDLNGAAPGLGQMAYDLHGRFDFAIPAMESRRVFIYTVVDVDMSGGPHDGRIYVAFTDENAAAGSPGNGSGSASQSHGWIQVVYSDDQGVTWNVAATPHSTVDQTTVDRFQPWMRVDAVGNVHIGWQDTRNSGAGLRDKSDWYYAMSTDGGATWIEETRVSSEVSQNINDGQEWGDYNGLAVSADNVVVGMTWTDNRIVSAPSTTSQRSFAGLVENAGNGPSYQMSSSPDTFLLCAGDPVPLIDVTLTASGGFVDPVALDTPGLDTGTFPSAVFSPNPALPLPGGAVSQLQLSTNPGAIAGSYAVTVQGSNGGATPIVRNNSLAFEISAGTPAAANLVFPADGAGGIANQPVLQWDAVSGAQSYLVEVATDAGFTSIVRSGMVQTNEFEAVNLDPLTTYFWRVTASNTCADAPASAVRSFTTAAIACSVFPAADLPLPIPSSGTSGTTESSIVIPAAQGGSIVDVDVLGLSGTHTWMGDLDFRLISPAATNLQIMARACGSADDFNINFDDAAPAGAWPCPPTDGGSYQPSEALAGFNGEEAAGSWTLRVTDNAGGDSGQLDSWELRVCRSLPFGALDDSYSVAQDGVLNVAAPGVLDNDMGSGLSAVLLGGVAHGALNLNPDGSFDYTPSTGYCGPDAFSYEMSDGVDTDQGDVNLDVVCPNAPPEIVDQLFALDENSANGSVVGTLAASDPNIGDTLSFAVTGGSGAGIFALDAGSGQITVADAAQLDYETSTSFSLDVSVTDAAMASDSASITIELNNLNEAPELADQGFAVDENSANSTPVGTLAASDPDAGDTLSFALTGGSGAGVFAVDSGGAITVSDAAALDFESTSSFSLLVSVSDAGLLSDSATVTITINDVNEAPGVADQGFAVDENSANGTPVGTLAASDPDAGDVLSFAVTGGSGAGAFAVNSSSGAITVSNAALLDFETSPSLTLLVTVTDAGMLSDSAAITININDVNEAPSATSLANQSGTEGLAFVFDTAAAFGDPDGDALSYSATGLPASLGINAGSGQISGVPLIGEAGTYAVTVRASDGAFPVDAAFELVISAAGVGIFSDSFED